MGFTFDGTACIFILLLSEVRVKGDSMAVNTTLETLLNVTELLFPRLHFLILPNTGCIFRYKSNETAVLQPMLMLGYFKTSDAQAHRIFSDFKRRQGWHTCQISELKLKPGDVFSGQVVFQRMDTKQRRYVAESFQVKSLSDTSVLVPKVIYANLRKKFVDKYVYTRHIVEKFTRRKGWYSYKYTHEVLELDDVFFGRCMFLRKDVRDRKHYVDDPFLIKITNTTPYVKNKQFRPLRIYTPKFFGQYLEKVRRKEKRF